MSLFSDLFTWWNGTTFSTRVYTKRHGRKVGSDAYGNTYYEERRDPKKGERRRRWVIYTDLAEASKVPPEWHGWLHYIVDDTPGSDYQARVWQKPHVENKTGTPDAYRPSGSILAPQRRRVGAPDYEPWQAE